MNILGIETSCDETAISVVMDGRYVLSSIVSSQIDLHKPYGGVVPEIAARSHLEVILPLIEESLSEAFGNLKNMQIDPIQTLMEYWNKIDGIAVTYGPGLPGALLVGVLTAKSIAMTLNKPLVAVDHVHAHAYAGFLSRLIETKNIDSPDKLINSYQTKLPLPAFPTLALIVSGGHTQLVLFKNHFDYEMLGQTLDDAAGEAFDKVAKILGLDYPGGPAIAKAAQYGEAKKYTFPKVKTPGVYDFSFSGLKTATLRHTQHLAQKDYSFPSFKLSRFLTDQQIYDTAAGFQYSVVNYLLSKTKKAYDKYSPSSIILAGGVASNTLLREQMHNEFGKKLFIPPIEYCTDNAAMIAGLGYQYFAKGKFADPITLETNPSLSMSNTI